MDPSRKMPTAFYAGVAVVFLAVLGVAYWQIQAAAARREAAKALCDRWAADLDGRTESTGAYIRYDGDTLPDLDPWGTPLRVAYSSGGLAEKVEVRSWGPDRQPHTADDITAWRLAANSENIADGAMRAAGKLAKSGAKGAINGAKEKLGVGK